MTPETHDPETIVEGDTPLPPALTMDAARALIAKRHGTGLDGDDPLLMMVTLHEAFIADHERLFERHNAALTTVIGSAIGGLTDKALSDHLQDQVRLADRIEQTFRHQYRRARILSAVNLCAALVCIPVAIVLLIR